MITLKSVTLRRSAKVLLDGASVTINPGEKVGLVGRNGAGKSTLFALLNGTLHEDGGDFYRPAAWRLAQVAQEMPETEMSATEFVIEGDTRLMAAEAEVKAAEAADDGERMANAYMALHDAGSHDAEARAQALILIELLRLITRQRSDKHLARYTSKLFQPWAEIEKTASNGFGLFAAGSGASFYYRTTEMGFSFIIRIAVNNRQIMIKQVMFPFGLCIRVIFQIVVLLAIHIVQRQEIQQRCNS